MKKKIIAIVVILCLVTGSGIRICRVNKDVERQKISYFQTNETVEYGQDFNIDSSKIIDGYTIKVLDSEVLSTKELYRKYNLMTDEEELMEDPFVKYYYIVKVIFSNNDNKDGETRGIDLSNLFLTGKDYSVVVNCMSYEMINPNMPKGLGFSLRPDTSVEVLIPFAIIPENMAKSEKDAYKKLTEEPPMLQITSYPTKKLIATKDRK